MDDSNSIRSGGNATRQPLADTRTNEGHVLQELVLQGYDEFPDSCLYHFLCHPSNRITALILDNPEERTVVSPNTLYQLVEGIVHNYHLQTIKLEWGDSSTYTSYLPRNATLPNATGGHRYIHHTALLQSRSRSDAGVPGVGTPALSTSSASSYGNLVSPSSPPSPPSLSFEASWLQRTMEDDYASAMRDLNANPDQDPVMLLPFSYAVYREHVDFYLLLNKAGRKILLLQDGGMRMCGRVDAAVSGGADNNCPAPSCHHLAAANGSSRCQSEDAAQTGESSEMEPIPEDLQCNPHDGDHTTPSSQQQQQHHQTPMPCPHPSDDPHRNDASRILAHAQCPICHHAEAALRPRRIRSNGIRHRAVISGDVAGNTATKDLADILGSVRDDINAMFWFVTNGAPLLCRASKQ